MKPSNRTVTNKRALLLLLLLLFISTSGFSAEKAERWVVEFTAPATGSVTGASKNSQLRLQTNRALDSSFDSLRSDLKGFSKNLVSPSSNRIVFEYAMCWPEPALKQVHR